MWRRKYLMAGRKFDFKNRKIVIALVFCGSSPIEPLFTSVPRSGQLIIPREKMNKISIYRWRVSRGRFEKLFFDRHDERIDSTNVTPICPCNVVENKNVVSVLDSVIKSFCNSIVKIGNYVLYVCTPEILCFVCSSLYIITSIHNSRAVYYSL